MFQNDYPLLGTPALTALILTLAETGPVTPEACTRRLAELLETAHERPALTPEALAERFAGHIQRLGIAGLLEPAADGAWRLTGRGREALGRYPGGLDASDLLDYPDYAAHVRAEARRTARTDPRAASYDEGYEARREGQPFTANPHAPTTVDHLSWENGWMQALDDAQGG